MDSIRLYLRYIGISIRGQMQYRASFVMLSLGTFLTTLIEFSAVWALFVRFGSLKGWSLAEVALLYAMASISFSVAEAIVRGFDTFPAMVKGGDFDRLLLRPRSTVLQLFGQELQLMRVGRLLQGLLIFGWAISSGQVVWTLPKVMLLLSAVLGGACLFSGIFILQATLSFWTIETLEIMNTITYGGREAAQYPLTIYRVWFQRLFTMIIPLACVNYLPGVAILGRTDTLGIPRLVQWASPLVGLLFLLIALRAWEFGVRHYCSTGS